MKIKLLTGLAGAEYVLGPGDERDFPNDEAARLIEAGFAVPVSEPKTERAVLRSAPETRKAGANANRSGHPAS